VEVLTGLGTTVAVHDLGGEGEPLLICHATGFCGRAYQPLATALAERHHVFAVDLRGHGDSPPPPDLDFDWQSMTADVRAAAHAISPGPIHAIGHSLGGAIALQTQATYGDVFTTAYLYEPIVVEPGRTMPNRNPMAVSARARTEVFSSKKDALWHYANRTQLGGLTAASLAAYVDHGFETLPDGRVRLKCRAEWEARTFEATGGVTTETVAGVSIPVVVAVGDEPDSPLVALGPGIVDALEDTRLLSYHRFGHFGPLQPPRRIVDDVFALTGDSASGRPSHSSADS
jgi:pimeloyl-ACP methyl ester carboxylesterase